MSSNITAQELFDRIATFISDATLQPSIVNKMMHETLVLTCAEGLKDTQYGFGDLNAQVETLICKFNIGSEEANAIRQMRRHSNRSTALSPEVLTHDAHALALLVSRVFVVDIPDKLVRSLPWDMQPTSESIRSNSPDKRCIVTTWDEHTISVIVDEDSSDSHYTVRYTEETQYARMEYLNDILREGMHLNLLGCEASGNTITPRLIIVEPDCLLDISTIASCFEDYGHHPLLYLVSRMRPKTNTQATLLGNFAGSALDDIINNSDFNLAHSLTNNFKEKALEYSTCMDFDAEQFKQDALLQTANLQQIVNELRQHYDLDHAVLEPSFICEKLGIQGRVDLMTTDLKLLVEQKSGRNIFIEHNAPNAHGAKVVEKHYVQLLLYYGILYYNFNQSHTDIRLLYSKYPLPDGLISVTQLMKLVYEAIRFRNEAIAIDFDIALHGPEKQLEKLTIDNLNTAQMSGFFYENYLRPQLESVLQPLQNLQPLEHAYFCRMLQFVVRENLLAKVGVIEGTGNSVANLWNMPLTEKRETGNIYTGLTILSKEKGAETRGYNSYDLITLSVPDQGDDFLPNFRRGDMVYLYAYPADKEPDVRRAMLFRGGIAEIHTDKITVQISPAAYPLTSSLWCIEHASSDVGGGASIRSLYEFITATVDRKALLLGQRAPQCDKNVTLSRSYDPILDPILLRAKQAKDYFLLVGPPGTGKTSRALRYLVEEELGSHTEQSVSPQPSPIRKEEQQQKVSTNSSPSLIGEGQGEAVILLLSYTNRAVDEICGMLVEAGIDFIRLGNELSCAKAYVPYLISNAIGERAKLSDMRQRLFDARIVVSTTSMLQSRPYLFNLKHFSLAIVDESSQILEPGIIGLLSSHHASADGHGEMCDIDKFILIGDYKQLPAVVQQSDRDATITEPKLNDIGFKSCKDSLFQRLIRQEHSCGSTDFIGILQRQGRMHPEIAEFPELEFYFDEQLFPVPLRHQTEESLHYDIPSEDATDDILKRHRLLFFASRDNRRPDISDKVNAEEAHIVADLLRRIRRFYGEKFDAVHTIGVIVPYRNQIAMIRREIERLNMPELLDISIDTVERYQGSQRDVIIYSFTIQRHYQLDFLTANTFAEHGHLIDRKLNVALTRARKQLILTGNLCTLQASPVFAKLIDYIDIRQGLFRHDA